MEDKGKTYWAIEKLKEWDKNPRGITPENLDRLKKQIQELGEYKPLLITPDGEVIGGNMRLKAYKDLGFKRCWVSIVEPKNEEEKLKYALSDNDRAGYYIEEDLANLLKDVSFDLSEFKVDIGDATDISTLIGNLNIPEGDFIEGDQDIEESEDEEFGDLQPYLRLGDYYCDLDTDTYDKLKKRIEKEGSIDALIKRVANEQD